MDLFIYAFDRQTYHIHADMNGYQMVLLRCNQHKPQNQIRKFKRNGCCNFYVFNTLEIDLKCSFGKKY